MPKLSKNAALRVGEKLNSPSSASPTNNSIVETLNSRFDELNSLWIEAEKRLQKYPIPYSVSFIYESKVLDERSQEGLDFYLGFQKHGESKRICVGTYCDFEPEAPINWKPITECSIEVRLDSICYLERLENEVIKAAKESLAKVDAGIESLRKFIAKS